jgi:hypothetical protein
MMPLNFFNRILFIDKVPGVGKRMSSTMNTLQKKASKTNILKKGFYYGGIAQNKSKLTTILSSFLASAVISVEVGKVVAEGNKQTIFFSFVRSCSFQVVSVGLFASIL